MDAVGIWDIVLAIQLTDNRKGLGECVMRRWFLLTYTQTRCRVTWSVRLLDVDDRRSRQGSLTVIERDMLSHFATS